jgi:putative endonuclease
MNKGGYIYIMTNKYKTTLYVGVTNNLQRRVWEHRAHYIKGSFTDKYNLESCIYYEYFPTIEQAIDRETEIKKWSRNKKEKLIAALNPDWSDLWEAILGC